MTTDPQLFEPEHVDAAAPTIKRTEHDMLALLRDRYGAVYGNGIRYASAAHVRSHAAFDARRTADFIAMDLWPSKGLALHGHEVKVSRSDWLTELAQPEKAQEFIPYMDFWWLVVADRRIVRDGELPDGWGLMAPRGNQLAVVKPAAQQPNPQPLSRSRLAAFVRAIAKGAA